MPLSTINLLLKLMPLLIKGDIYNKATFKCDISLLKLITLYLNLHTFLFHSSTHAKVSIILVLRSRGISKLILVHLTS